MRCFSTACFARVAGVAQMRINLGLKHLPQRLCKQVLSAFCASCAMSRSFSLGKIRSCSFVRARFRFSCAGAGRLDFCGVARRGPAAAGHRQPVERIVGDRVASDGRWLGGHHRDGEADEDRRALQRESGSTSGFAGVNGVK